MFAFARETSLLSFSYRAIHLHFLHLPFTIHHTIIFKQPQASKSLIMDFINKLASGQNNNNEQAGQNQQVGQNEQGSSSNQSGGGGFLGGLGDKFNSAAGGGKESEKNEDYLDKGMPLQHISSHPRLYSLRYPRSSTEFKCRARLTQNRSRFRPREVHGWREAG